MITYTLWSSTLAMLRWVKGEKGLHPGYAADAYRRTRRSLFDLRSSFMFGADTLFQGRYRGCIMGYAATIGEFHPLEPVIDAYLKRHPGTPLVLLAGQLQYVDALHAAYPEAAVGVPPPAAPWLYERLFHLARPAFVALGEGPCLHLHFPIRFDLAIPAECLRHRVPMIVANATMHRYTEPSWLDRLEHRLFGSLLKDAIRCWYTPNHVFESWLRENGVPEERIRVTGDLRFDGLKPLGPVQSADFSALLKHLRRTEAPIVVAGSVNALDEEAAVIDGWLELRKEYPSARLIMAPRHINNHENMDALYGYLRDKKIRFARRSEGVEEAKRAEALIVDVFGELPYYYSVATIAYIGRNHGVLEPLRFEVPTVVAPRTDWASDYVTFPYYKRMIDAGGIIEARTKAGIGGIFLKIMEAPAFARAYVSNALKVAEQERGAGERIAEDIDAHVLTARRTA